MTWESDAPVGLLNPTQQSATAVSLMTASFFGALCVTGLVVTFGFAVATGRTVAAAAVADGFAPRVETTW